MKNSKVFLAVLLMIISGSMYSQIRIGGGISIGVHIDLPIPDIVVVEQRSDIPRRSTRCRRAVIHTCDHRCDIRFGTLHHQNGPNRSYVYEVVGASLIPIANGEEKVMYSLDTGEVLELIISTVNPNDYNYQYFDPGCRNCLETNNTIVAIFFNNQELPIRNGSLSLQPIGNSQFRSVINVSSIYQGDFNGSVNF